MPKQIIYADYAATTPLLQQAYDAMQRFLLSEFANPSQPYSIAREPKKALYEARQAIAECINAKPNEIFFTSGGTESDNWAIKGTMLAYGDHRSVITDAIEHHAVLRSCEAIERLGFPVAYLQPDVHGVISPYGLKSFISDQTKLISVMLVNNEIGTIEPIHDLAIVAHDMGAVFHTDAVQAVGHISVDVKELGVDMLSASAHKFGGPRGVGFLYVHEDVTLPPFMDGGSQEAGMRAGTENVAAVVGMAAALKTSCREMHETAQRLYECEKILVSSLADSRINFIRNGAEHHVPGNVSLSFRDADGEMLLHRLDLMGICISTGSACNSINTQHSHVIESIGIPRNYADGTIRISFGRDSSLKDAEMISSAIIKVLARYL
jgi:cysteine desulfurase